MNKLLTLTSTALMFVATSSVSAAESPKFKANWDSLAQYQQAPEWFQDAKFGIYAHWGPYSATKAAFGSDWYSRNMYVEGHPLNSYHKETYGDLKNFGYKDFIPMFKAEKFNATEWAKLYKAAGAKFAGPVAEHADGFAMWDTQLTPWNAADMGPKRDVVAELEKAIRGEGLKFMTSFHHHWKWGWYPTSDKNTDASNPKNEALYGPTSDKTAWGTAKANGVITPLHPETLPPQKFADEWLAKVNEVVDRYKPDLLWFDNRMNILPEQTRMDMAANYYNSAEKWKKDVVLTYKTPDLLVGSATIDLERNRMSSIYPQPWLTDTSVGVNSWGYAEPMKYYSAQRLVQDLVDIVSKNGSVLLNIAPKADGTIPQEQKDLLLAIGGWLKVNGEAIYATRPWYTYGEGPTITPEGHLADLHFKGFSPQDIRYTRSKDNKTLYAIKFGQSTNDTILKALSRLQYGHNIKVKSVELIGKPNKIEWQQSKEGLTIKHQKISFNNDLPFVYKIQLEN